MKETKEKGLYRRRGSPHWCIRYSDRNGRICRMSTGTTVKSLARDILNKKRTAVAENRHLEVKKVPNTTLFELCQQYWDTRGKHFLMKGLDSMIEIWKEGLGNVLVKELTTAKIEKFLNDRMNNHKKFSTASRNRHLTMMRAMFNWGVQECLVMENPTTGIRRFRENGARTRFLDQEEVQRMFAATDDTFRPTLTTGLHTGMRRGEIIKLKWPDVDLQNRVLVVQQSKSGKRRTIPIDETLYETLRGLPSRFKQGYVFLSSKKEGCPMKDISHAFARIAKKAELKNVRFHDLRHTFASHLLINGADLKTVQELLGHASITMTMRYAHLVQSHRAKTVRLLDTAFQTDTKTDTMKNPELSANVSSAFSARGVAQPG